MADRWAVANGNWSATATWNGGTLPTSADDVYADGFTVAIDQDITVLSIRTTARAGGTAGGGFTNAATRTITGNLIAGTTTCLTTTAGVLVIGSITGGASANARGLLCVTANMSHGVQNGTLTGGSAATTHAVDIITGTGQTLAITNCALVGGSNATAAAINFTSGGAAQLSVSATTMTANLGNCVSFGSAATLTSTISASSTVSAASTGHVINQSSTGQLTITFSTAPSVPASTGRIVNLTGAGNASVTAPSVTGGAAANRHAISLTGGGKLRFTGNVNGGSGANAFGIQVGTGQLLLLGNVTGLAGAGVGVSGGTGQFFIHGNCAGVVTHAVFVTNAHTSTFDRSYVYGSLTGNVSNNGVRNEGAMEIVVFTTSTSGTTPFSNAGSGSITQVALGGTASSRMVNINGGADQ